MTILELNPDLVFRVTGDPAVYAQAPFLLPMQKPALNLAARFRGACTSCAKNAKRQAAMQMANAFSSLVLAESAKSPNALPELHKAVHAILRTPDSPIQIRYFKDGKEALFSF
jgi:hypothetical protein